MNSAADGTGSGPATQRSFQRRKGSKCHRSEAAGEEARVFPSFDDRGTLNVGAPADVAILELREGTFEFVDNYKGTRTGSQRLFPAATVLAGKQAQRV
jgi:predicted amidohydrolase